MKILVSRMRIVGEGTLRASCWITIVSNANTEIMDMSVKVMCTGEELFVVLPSEKGKDGKWYKHVFIKDSALRAAIDSAVLGAYQRQTLAPPAPPEAPMAEAPPAVADTFGF